MTPCSQMQSRLNLTSSFFVDPTDSKLGCSTFRWQAHNPSSATVSGRNIIRISMELANQYGWPFFFVGPLKGPTIPCGSQPSTILSHQSYFQSLVSTGTEMDSSLLPLKSFVHEVLKDHARQIP